MMFCHCAGCKACALAVAFLGNPSAMHNCLYGVNGKSWILPAKHND